MKTKSARRTKSAETNGSSSEPLKLTDESENKRHKSTDGKISGSTSQGSDSETEKVDEKKWRMTTTSTENEEEKKTSKRGWRNM